MSSTSEAPDGVGPIVPVGLVSERIAGRGEFDRTVVRRAARADVGRMVAIALPPALACVGTPIGLGDAPLPTLRL